MVIDSRISRVTRTRFAEEHPRAFLALEAAAGVVLAAASLWAFLAIADEIPERSRMVRTDLFVSAWLQQVGTETGESIFRVVSWFGAPVLGAVLLVVIVTLAWKRDWRRAIALTIAAGGGTLLNYGLKTLFHRGRPEYASEFVHHPSWSFPSGHAMGSLIGYGFLAFLLLERTQRPMRRRLIVLATVVLVGAIGFSRMYLGVHYLSDVVGGYLAGMVWLLACIAGYEFAGRDQSGATAPPSSPVTPALP
ncbi:MAG: phosphatase PAP2 family protein [bacterium]